MQNKRYFLFRRIWSACFLFFLSMHLIQAQEKSIDIKGIIKDELGESISGVNVQVKGTTLGTSTDEKGVFLLNLTDLNAILVFTSIGYETTEIPLDGRTSFDVVLKADNRALEEVVVVGYGAQRKSDITGSVSVVDVGESKKFSTNDMSQLLQGRSAGVSVTSDGHPGAAPNVRIRGLSTFGDAQPLYVIDGVPVGTSPRDFNPNDIESMQVLKDASAGAIYGSRAANGVIIITTKQGQLNTPLRIEYNGYYGIDKVWQRIPVLDRERYQMIVNEVRSNAGQSLIPGNDPNSSSFIDNVDTDWQKEGIKTGNRQNHNLNFSGGGNNTTYNMSFDYFGNNGTFVGNGPNF
ncbi:TonB-dependent receptor plug domain-containing protein [Olivibacter sp. SDN3]|uniref:TonB-dependent receptor plug domain-containing protein n=1 Tax=Olivibacter sp. SDN3 TaxID=2764720 RepID=UPI001C9E4976|nr:TonB-dependent receptor plug domain-containing protein [Olivibacter sp. SDN3]